MNIVKFKDNIIEGDVLFNNKFKGRYAWWINCKWAVSFDDMDTNAYIEASQMGEAPEYIDYLVTADYYLHVDDTATEKINNQMPVCRIFNTYALGPDICLGAIKRFRTWLAESLIYIASDPDDDQYDSHGYGYEIDTMLQYYAHNMYDSTVEALQHFGYATNLAPTKPSCGCTAGTTVLGTNVATTCDSLAGYRSAIYNMMVKTFSNVDFWIDKSDFCVVFKQFVDAIIQSGLPLSRTISTTPLDFCDCTCTGQSDTQMTMILKNLSIALEYIYTGEVATHRNFIYTSLYQWSSQLYENMQWQ